MTNWSEGKPEYQDYRSRKAAPVNAALTLLIQRHTATSRIVDHEQGRPARLAGAGTIAIESANRIKLFANS